MIYKTIPSLLVRNSPTDYQLSQMTIMTQSRPIDDPRRVEFVANAGDVVTMLLPDLRNIEAYTLDGEKRIRKSPQELEQAIRDYLTDTVKRYNDDLKQQNDQQSAYYTAHRTAFGYLQGRVPGAVPRAYTAYLPEDLLVDAISDELIGQIAYSLFLFNGGFAQ